MRPMHTRRSLALLAGAILLTAPLTSCGFDEATDRVNTIVSGVSDRDASVDVLNAVIVSAEEGSGTLIATFVNNDTTEQASIDAVEPADDTAQVTDFSSITLEPGSLLNLAAEDQEGIALQGEVAAGGIVPLRIQLSGGEIVELEVPVVPSCEEYEGLDATSSSGSSDLCEVAHEEGGH